MHDIGVWLYKREWVLLFAYYQKYAPKMMLFSSFFPLKMNDDQIALA